MKPYSPTNLGRAMLFLFDLFLQPDLKSHPVYRDLTATKGCLRDHCPHLVDAVGAFQQHVPERPPDQESIEGTDAHALDLAFDLGGGSVPAQIRDDAGAARAQEQKVRSNGLSANANQAEGTSRLVIHVRTRVVFPKPVGALRRLIFFVRAASRRASKCSRRTIFAGSRGGINLA